MSIQESWEDKRKIEEWKTLVGWRSAMISLRTASATSMASVCVNTMILANSASAAALLAYLATTRASATVLQPATFAVALFGFGVFCGMLTAGFGYFSLHCALERDHLPEEDAQHAKHERRCKAYGNVAVAFGILGIASFPCASWLALTALRIVGGG